MRKSRPLAIVLALFLCGSQLAAAQHGVHHLVAPPDHVCAQCLHQPGQKYALVEWTSLAAAASADPAALPVAVPVRNGATRNTCQSRAPPIFLR